MAAKADSRAFLLVLRMALPNQGPNLELGSRLVLELLGQAAAVYGSANIHAPVCSHMWVTCLHVLTFTHTHTSMHNKIIYARYIYIHVYIIYIYILVYFFIDLYISVITTIYLSVYAYTYMHTHRVASPANTPTRNPQILDLCVRHPAKSK